VYFLHVFSALKHSTDKAVLFCVISYIKCYVHRPSQVQKDVVNPDTIIWLLEVLEEHKHDKKLCLASAKTLLAFVSNHSIVFDYQEVAIIKKFNHALQNLDVFESAGSALDQSVDSHNSKRSKRKGSRRVSSRQRSSKSGFTVPKLMESEEPKPILNIGKEALI